MRGNFGGVETPALSELAKLRTEVHDKFQWHENEVGLSTPGRNSFYGATDALQDAHEALLFLEKGFPLAGAKLSVYGLLQALFIQQDAVVVLDALTRFGSPDKQDKTLYGNPLFGPIRILRHRVAGHPVYAKHVGGTASIPLVRDPYFLEAAIYCLEDGSDADRFPRFHIGSLINDNAAGLIPILSDVNGRLDSPKDVFDRMIEAGQFKASGKKARR